MQTWEMIYWAIGLSRAMLLIYRAVRVTRFPGGKDDRIGQMQFKAIAAHGRRGLMAAVFALYVFVTILAWPVILVVDVVKAIRR